MGILPYVAVGVVCFIVGWSISYWSTVKTFAAILHYFGITNEDLESMNDDLVRNITKPDETEVAITVEEVDGLLYAYTKENPRFLAQGRNREELLKALAAKLHDVTVLISEDDAGFHLLTSKD